MGSNGEDNNMAAGVAAPAITPAGVQFAVGIGPYTDDEPWDSYIERLDMYFEACNVTDASRKRGIFLASVGKQTYQLVKNLLNFGELPKDKTYEELTDLISRHKNPTPPWQAERLKFLNRDRRPNETVSEYVAALRHLAGTCKFTSDEFDNQIRDRLMHGIRDSKMQIEMINVGTTVTLKTAMDAAMRIELSRRSVREMSEIGRSSSSASAGPTSAPSDVNFVKKKYSPGSKPCWRCTGRHDPSQCRYKNETCFSCSGRGHVKAVCPNKSEQKPSGPNTQNTHFKQHKQNKSSKKHFSKMGKSHYVGEDSRSGVEERSCEENAVCDQSDEGTDCDESYSLYMISELGKAPIMVDVTVNGELLKMEVDTGATYSVIGQDRIPDSLRGQTLKPSSIVLQTYGAEQLKVVGGLSCTVQYGEQVVSDLSLLVVPGDRPALLGRNWMSQIQFDWLSIGAALNVSGESGQAVRWKGLHVPLFEATLGKLPGFKARVRMKPTARPKFCKAASVPYAVRDELGKELDRLVSDGVLEKVDFAEWASRIVVVRKQDRSLRVCADFKPTVNPQLEVNQYPLPTPEDLFSKLAGGVMFTVLDLSHAYQQIELEEDSRQYVVVNTHKGLYRYTRLPYGIASAPAIFQNVMESLLSDIPGVGIYLDDLLITGKSAEEHDRNVEQVLDKLEKSNMRLKFHKCSFSQDEVRYLGHRINSAGIKPLPDKVRAIAMAPDPTDVSELRSFLGLVQYYQKFLPNLSSMLEPLHELLRQSVPWHWGQNQREAVKAIKAYLQSEPLLVHYDVTKPIVVSCDASPYGIGAVLSHVDSDGLEHPVAFASRKLASAERNYSQLDKEGLALVFAVKKFHKYLSGREFVLVTDHRPLLGLLGENRPIPQQASPRLQRWAITLAGYDYKLQYRKGSENGNADCLSRLPLSQAPKDVPLVGDIRQVVEHVDACVSVNQIKTWTRRDAVLSRVCEFVMTGFPVEIPTTSPLRPYWLRRYELSVEDGVLLWGNRVVMPSPGQSAVLSELHETHPGVSRMKALARSYVYWPNLDRDIEQVAKGCQTCQVHRKDPAGVPLHPWEWPSRPWYRVHADFLGPFLGKDFLLLIDAHSKWMEVHIMGSTSTEATIEKMEMSFASTGLPVHLVTDNGPQFVSERFASFCAANGIKHITSAPYHPSTNGLAERGVQVFKRVMKKMEGGSLQSRVSRFLARYRVTPQATTGSSPAVLMGRKVRCVLDNIKPDLAGRVLEKQGAQKFHHDKHAIGRSFEPNDTVFYRDYSTQTKDRYSSGVVKRRTGPVSAEIETSGGVHRRHFDQLFHREENIPPGQQPCTSDGGSIPEVPHNTPPPPLTAPELMTPHTLPSQDVTSVSRECPSTVVKGPPPGPVVPSTGPSASIPLEPSLQSGSPWRDKARPNSPKSAPTPKTKMKTPSAPPMSGNDGVRRQNPPRDRKPPVWMDSYSCWSII